jgi:hypothetical protein
MGWWHGIQKRKFTWVQMPACSCTIIFGEWYHLGIDSTLLHKVLTESCLQPQEHSIACEPHECKHVGSFPSPCMHDIPTHVGAIKGEKLFFSTGQH